MLRAKNGGPSNFMLRDRAPAFGKTRPDPCPSAKGRPQSAIDRGEARYSKLVAKGLSIVLHRIGHRTLYACSTFSTGPSFPHAPEQGPGLRKNLSGPLHLRQRTARKRPKQNNRALSPQVSFSFCPMCQATPERTSLGNLFGKDVAAKVLLISVLCILSARFYVRKYQDLAHSQVISRHVLTRTR